MPQITVLDVLMWLAIGAMILAMPVWLVGTQVWKGDLRIRFGIATLLTITAVVAVVFGIARLPFPWPFRAGLIWTVLLCAIGFATSYRRSNKPAAR